MRILIAEDDMTSRYLLQNFLIKYGECDLAVNGVEAVEFFMSKLDNNKYYDLICLDIIMPKFDGISVLKTIRDIEKTKGVEKENKANIIMTTALNDKKTITESYNAGCDAYMWKPIDIEKLKQIMEKLSLL